jgi:hypothetical protein
MRKLKKFKRYDQGGAVGAGSGDPFSYTDFSDRARNLKKPSEAAEIDDSRERYASTSASGMMNPSLRPGQGRRRDDDAEKPAETASTAKPSVRDSAKDTAQTSFDYPAQRESKRDDYEGGASPTSGSQTFRRAAPKPAGPKAAEKDVKYGGEAIKISSGASGFKFPDKSPQAASPDQIPGTDVKTPYRGEKIDNSNLAAKQLAQSTLGATAVGRGLGSGLRGAMGLGRMFESATKPAPKQGELFDAKGNPTAEATRVSPKKEPQQGRLFDDEGNATAEAARSAAKPAPKEAPTRVDPRAAANRRAAESETKEAPTRADPRAAANRRAAESEGKQASKEAPKEAPKAKPAANDEVAQEAAKRAAASRRTVTPKRQEDSAKFGGGKGTPSKAKTRPEVKPTAKKFDRPVGEKEGPTVNKVLEREGLPIKKGGKIPAFKKGGLVGRADGCAIRGKTRGRMV